MKRTRWIGVGAATVVVCGAAWSVGAALAQDAPPSFELRGHPVDPDHFSLTSMQSPDDLALTDATRAAVFDQCMAAKGFADADANTPAYTLAANGDDGSDQPPPPRQVDLPGGSTAEVSMTWTPESCIYRSFATLGSDPVLREAMRQQMMMLLVEADRAAAARLQEATADWLQCVGGAGSATDLFRAVDGTSARPGVIDPGQSDQRCLNDELRKTVRHVRGLEHLKVAAAHDELVHAWVDLVDHEVAQAAQLD